MSARAMWKAEVALGKLKVPVKLYAAVQERAVHFRLLDEQSHEPVRQQLIDAEGEPLAEGAAVQGLQVDEGLYVVVTPEELAALAPEESRTIEIERCVAPSEVAEVWYDRPYWLGPDGDDEAYFALVWALAEEGRIGIAHWTMRRQRYDGALRVNGSHLMLVRMRHAEDVASATELAAPTGRAADAREIALAEQLVTALMGPFEPSELEGTYHDRVRELVEAKAAGKVVRLKTAKAKRATKAASLAGVLEKSLEALSSAGRGARSRSATTQKAG